jgi:hypothetical protein
MFRNSVGKPANFNTPSVTKFESGINSRLIEQTLNSYVSEHGGKYDVV